VVVVGRTGLVGGEAEGPEEGLGVGEDMWVSEELRMEEIAMGEDTRIGVKVVPALVVDNAEGVSTVGAGVATVCAEEVLVDDVLAA